MSRQRDSKEYLGRGLIGIVCTSARAAYWWCRGNMISSLFGGEGCRSVTQVTQPGYKLQVGSYRWTGRLQVYVGLRRPLHGSLPYQVLHMHPAPVAPNDMTPDGEDGLLTTSAMMKFICLWQQDAVLRNFTCEAGTAQLSWPLGCNYHPMWLSFDG